MYHKTRGIVLHTIKYSETSIIAKIYTEKLGLLSYMVKGVRSAKSKSKATLLQPLTLLEMEVSHRENKQLQYIKEFKRSFVYQSIPFNTLKSTISVFILEVISKSIREHEPNMQMFEFVYESLCHLDEGEKVNPDFHLLFLVHFSRHLGFFPHGNFSEENCFFEMTDGIFGTAQNSSTSLNQVESKLLNMLLKTTHFDEASAHITKEERRKMQKVLLKYYQLHLDNFNLKSPEILEAILS